MGEYKILWKMKGLDWYFSTRTVPSQCETQFLDESGKIIHTVDYKDGNVSSERLFGHLKRYSETDPRQFFDEAREAGAQIIVGDADLLMEGAAAEKLQARFNSQVKLVVYEKTRPQEVKIFLDELDSGKPVYEER